MRLEAFLTENRAELIGRCRTKVAARSAPKPTDGEIERGIPLFIDQLIDTLRRDMTSNPDAAGVATKHGQDLMGRGFTVGQVVHTYGDVCQSVTDLAVEREEPISPEDFRVLNSCLDDAIAAAVTEFSAARDRNVGERLAKEGNERLGVLAHEVRNLLMSMALTFDVLKSGSVGIAGSSGKLMQRLLDRLGSVVDRSLADARLEAGTVNRERVEIRGLLEEIEVAATLSAKTKGVGFSLVTPVVNDLAVEADPQILSAVIVNLVQNAIKFTQPRSHVTLSVRVTADRVQIDVTDECGGLPPGAVEHLFQPFEQRSKNRSGVGLGLTIARRGAEASGGQLQVRDVPGTGCVFTVDLPRVR